MKAGLLGAVIFGMLVTAHQAADAPVTALPTSPVAPALPLHPISRFTGERFSRPGQFVFDKWKADLQGTAFRAVVTNDWLAGLVPVFGIEKTNRFELRRRPARGVENSSEPLFFAVPPVDDPDAARICGRWDCTATRADGSKPFLSWELSSDRSALSGRFDQNTDYRFGFITGGSFQQNGFELHVEYIMDGYRLNGRWENGTLTGEWKRTDASEEGKWTAQRAFPTVAIPEPASLVPLYEWRRADGMVRYVLAGDSLADGWQRAEKALCQVWTATP